MQNLTHLVREIRTRLVQLEKLLATIAAIPAQQIQATPLADGSREHSQSTDPVDRTATHTITYTYLVSDDGQVLQRH